MFQEAINNYLQSHGYNTINLKAVLFDMDGVLFNSMPNHAESWHKVMLRFGFGLSRDEAYMHEGRTGASTINIVSRRERGHDATEGLIPMVVTGSGQTSLLDRLNHNFPGIFKKELMVAAFDVKYGKPNPEPYLMALKKAHLQPNEALVIENAPLGVQAGVAAGIFTIAVNTGPLPDQVLWDEGANLLFPSMPAFNENWEILKQELKNK